VKGQKTQIQKTLTPLQSKL
jgi:hypothetical protein